MFSFPSGDPAEFAALTEEDQKALAFLEQFTSGGGLAYNQYQSAQLVSDIRGFFRSLR